MTTWIAAAPGGRNLCSWNHEALVHVGPGPTFAHMALHEPWSDTRCRDYLHALVLAPGAGRVRAGPIEPEQRRHRDGELSRAARHVRRRCVDVDVGDDPRRRRRHDQVASAHAGRPWGS